MKSSLAILALIFLFLIWKFVLSPDQLEFTDRAKVLQGLSLALEYKQAVFDHWRNSGELPMRDNWNDDQVNVDISQSIVGAIRVAEEGPGVISVYYVNKPRHEVPPAIAGKRINLVPVISGDKLNWSCIGTVPEEYLPGKCRHVDK